MIRRMCIKDDLHGVISLFENIEKAIDDKFFVCKILIDLQKGLIMQIITYCFINLPMTE